MGNFSNNYYIQANYLWIDDVMKYYVIIYQSLVKTSNGLNKKSSKNGSARNMLMLNYISWYHKAF